MPPWVGLLVMVKLALESGLIHLKIASSSDIGAYWSTGYDIHSPITTADPSKPNG